MKKNYSGLKGILKFITTIISWTALIILIILALFFAYYMTGNRLAEKNGGKFEPIVSLYTIISPSMTPNINVGDVVVAKKINSPQDIKVGDIITFISTSSISRGMTITHRVTEINQTSNGFHYTTKGDNNLSPDSSPAEYDNIIGKVVFRVPQLGKVQNLVANQGGWLVIVIIPALFIIISDILKVFKLLKVKNKVEKIDKKEKLKKKIKMKREEKRKEIIKKRLNIEKNINEPDPIKTNKTVKVIEVKENNKNTKVIKIDKNKHKVNNKQKKSKKNKKARNTKH